MAVAESKEAPAGHRLHSGFPHRAVCSAAAEQVERRVKPVQTVRIFSMMTAFPATVRQEEAEERALSHPPRIRAALEATTVVEKVALELGITTA